MDPATEQLVDTSAGASVVRRFVVTILDGEGAGTVWHSSDERCAIGSSERNELVLADVTVSRFHCEIVLTPGFARIRDLGSRNGTIVDGVRVFEAALKTGSLLRLGRTTLRFDLLAESNARRLSERVSFGSLAGDSVAMREVYGLLERAAASDATVLLEGETGTGKGAAAESLHAASARAGQPFVVIDCASLPPPLLESELFGHEKGAFTGATGRRIGAFEECAGGTIFLDEIGELPPELQPKLLRVLENRQIRRLGRNDYQRVDVRVVAATNRDLRAEVNAGRFRADLYYRLAVVKIALPALRQRPEDVPAIARRILAGLGATPATIDEMATPEFFASLRGAAWAGNVRELRNYLERCLVLGDRPPLGEPAERSAVVDAQLPYSEARRRALAWFERTYLEDLMRRHEGKVMAASRAAGLAREYVYRLLVRHGIGR